MNRGFRMKTQVEFCAAGCERDFAMTRAKTMKTALSPRDTTDWGYKIGTFSEDLWPAQRKGGSRSRQIGGARRKFKCLSNSPVALVRLSFVFFYLSLWTLSIRYMRLDSITTF